MDVIEAIKIRKSVRGFKSDPVPKKILREMLEIATRAPSGRNVQPWEITVATGEVLKNIGEEFVRKMLSGEEPTREFPAKPLEGVYRQRQVDLGVQLYRLLGVAREDMEGRARWNEKGYRFFGASAAIFISIDRSMSHWRFMDVGSLIQTICLSAMGYGLGTCISGQIVQYHEVIRKYTGIPNSRYIPIGIIIGYPDWDHPANKLVSTREPIDDVVRWCGFDASAT